MLSLGGLPFPAYARDDPSDSSSPAIWEVSFLILAQLQKDRKSSNSNVIPYRKFIPQKILILKE
jgi:hypothetical protein